MVRLDSLLSSQSMCSSFGSGGRLWSTDEGRLIGSAVLYMVIENFRDGDAEPVYRRFRDKGRMAPDGLKYVASWVTADLRRCFQIMECDDPSLLKQWMAHWEDLTEFEVIPVVTSAEAVAAVAPRL